MREATKKRRHSGGTRVSAVLVVGDRVVDCDSRVDALSDQGRLDCNSELVVGEGSLHGNGDVGGGRGGDRVERASGVDGGGAVEATKA